MHPVSAQKRNGTNFYASMRIMRETECIHNNTGTCATLCISVIQERASKVASLTFSKLYYTCVVNDSGDHTGS